MLFQYIGDKNEPPHTTVVFGREFTLGGEPVEVTDAYAIKKLSGMATFKAVEAKPEIIPEIAPKASKKGAK